MKYFILFLILLPACLPRGEKMRENYPELTNERKDELETALLERVENDERVDKFDNTIKEWLNHLIDIVDQDYSDKGLQVRGMEENRLLIVPHGKIKKFCGSSSGACNSLDRITLGDNYVVLDFLRVIFHEMGHTNNYNSNSELASQGNVLYLIFKSYQFSKPVGSLLLSKLFEGVINIKPEDVNDFNYMYIKGTLLSVYSLIKHGGDLEAAQEYIAHTKNMVLEAGLSRKLNQLQGVHHVKYFLLWEELLSLPEFKLTLTSRLTPVEADELITFLHILNYKFILTYQTNNQELLDRLVELQKEFLSKSQYKNSYFRGVVVEDYTNIHYLLLKESELDYGPNSPQVRKIALDIINVNQKYPCYSMNPYQCPPIMRIARMAHVDAYYYFISPALDTADNELKNTAVRLTFEYLDKFYPNGVMGVTKNVANNYIPLLAVKAVNHCINSGYMNTVKELLIAAIQTKCIDTWHKVNVSACNYLKRTAQGILNLHF